MARHFFSQINQIVDAARASLLLEKEDRSFT